MAEVGLLLHHRKHVDLVGEKFNYVRVGITHGGVLSSSQSRADPGETECVHSVCPCLFVGLCLYVCAAGRQGRWVSSVCVHPQPKSLFRDCTLPFHHAAPFPWQIRGFTM